MEIHKHVWNTHRDKNNWWRKQTRKRKSKIKIEKKDTCTFPSPVVGCYGDREEDGSACMIDFDFSLQACLYFFFLYLDLIPCNHLRAHTHNSPIRMLF